MKRLVCSVVQQLITAATVAELALPPPAARHQRRCLRCQAYSASLRQTRRALATLRYEREQPPPAPEHPFQLASTRIPASPLRWRTAATAGVVVGLVAAWGWHQLRSSAGRAVSENRPLALY